jgi:hypothetical protein
VSRAVAAVGLVVTLAFTLVGCAPEQLAANPLGPCGDDARAAGGYAELEDLLPGSFGPNGRAPDRVDSGRSCSEAALGTLKAHGVTELRFAGATWNGTSASEGTVVAVLATPNWVPPLEAAWVEEFYEAGARAGKKTDNVETSRPGIGGIGEVFWLDVLNDLSFQTVVTWQEDGLTHVVIVATDVAPLKDRGTHAAAVEAAILVASGLEPSSAAPCACATPPAAAPVRPS